MLEEVLRSVNNRFERETIRGTFSIENGSLGIDGAQEGQHFWVEGSVFNDGLHVYGEGGMDDETFTGKVTLLAIPKAVIDLAEEISAWCEENAEALSSPYQSESFGGYSYSKGPSQDGADFSWRSQFGSRLAPFRKVSRDWS